MCNNTATLLQNNRGVASLDCIDRGNGWQGQAIILQWVDNSLLLYARCKLMNWYFSMSCYSHSQGDSADALIRIMATTSSRIIDVYSPALMHVGAYSRAATNKYIFNPCFICCRAETICWWIDQLIDRKIIVSLIFSIKRSFTFTGSSQSNVCFTLLAQQIPSGLFYRLND